MSTDWSQAEVEAIVTDYFAMWDRDLRGLDYNKAEHNRRLRLLVPNRSRSSVEQKHRNISAVLWHLGYPYLRGYKPLPRYQNLLRSVVEDRLAPGTRMNRLIAKAVKVPAKLAPAVQDLVAIQVAPPRRAEVTELVADEKRRGRADFVRRNYLEAEANNHSLGLAGEKLILRHERERLWRAGKDALANRVEHVAKTKGDFLGYDILSFETSGRERFVEVKTTRYGAMTRFFVSANEVEVSASHKQVYHLHRIFNFDKQPQFYVLSGSLVDTCEIKPVSFSAVPN